MKAGFIVRALVLALLMWLTGLALGLAGYAVQLVTGMAANPAEDAALFFGFLAAVCGSLAMLKIVIAREP